MTLNRTRRDVGSGLPLFHSLRLFGLVRAKQPVAGHIWLISKELIDYHDPLIPAEDAIPIQVELLENFLMQI